MLRRGQERRNHGKAGTSGPSPEKKALVGEERDGWEGTPSGGRDVATCSALRDRLSVIIGLAPWRSSMGGRMGEPHSTVQCGKEPSDPQGLCSPSNDWQQTE